MQLKPFLPWYARVGAKIVLSRLPVRYAIWRRLNLYRHGAMLDASYALDVFEKHWGHLQGRPCQRAARCWSWGQGTPPSAQLSRVREEPGTRTLSTWGILPQRILSLYKAAANLVSARDSSAGLSPELWQTIRICFTRLSRAVHDQWVGFATIDSDDIIDAGFSHAVLEHETSKFRGYYARAS